MMLHKKVGAWLIDYAYALRGTLASLVHREPPGHYRGHVVAGKTPVILVQGVSLKWAFMKDFGDRISLLGHPVYIVPELGNNVYDIPSSAAMLRALIEKENLSGVIIVAHSKGGLIGKYVLVHHNADNRVRGIVAIATPFSGSALAKLVPRDSYKELRTDSELIKELGKHSTINKRIISIIPEYDNHVWAERGSFLDGAAENIEVPVSGHHKVLFSKVVLATVLDSIEKISKMSLA